MALNKKQMADRMYRYIRNNFRTQREAAGYYEVSDQYISLVVRGFRSPTALMLDDIGYERRTIWVKK